MKVSPSVSPALQVGSRRRDEALPLREVRRRWAELLRRIYEVDPLLCAACGGAMRILAFITEGAVINQILTQLRRTRGAARGPPSTQGPARRDMRTAPTSA